jgi:hypothetical protein
LSGEIQRKKRRDPFSKKHKKKEKRKKVGFNTLNLSSGKN